MSAIDQLITLAVLAGGQARRMDGEDKGLITVAGKPMVSHVLDRFAADAAQVQIIANRNQDRYQQLGYPVHADDLEGFQGPMAGMRTALAHCTTPYLVVLPCDVPMAPRDLVHKLFEQLQATDAEIAVACDDEREHSVILLMKANLTDSIDAFLANGDRKILLWYNQHRVTKVTFAGQAQAFANINTAEQRDQLEQLLLADKDS